MATTNTTSIHYTTTGSVRGECGHWHRSLRGAIRCIERDQKGCRGQGGYSDRCVARISGQAGEAIRIEPLTDEERDAADEIRLAIQNGEMR